MDIDEQARSRVGLVFNQKYTLGRLIGAGGMAAVYEGSHRNGHRVAIKVLHRHVAANEDLRARFLREGYVANKVAHPGAVRVVDDDIAEDGSVFLVMDLLEGETLEVRVRRAGGRLPAPEVCALAFQALDVLAVAHEAGIVHRDVKPENLFLTAEGALKVLDFGIARVLLETPESPTVTRAGTMMGTPAFMAPEQALGQSARINGQTDLWAVAATMFTTISGQFVHEAATTDEMLIRAGSLPARSVLAVMPDLPARVAHVIDRALSFDNGERWHDARAMQAVLEDAYLFAYGAPIPEGRDSSRAPASSAVAFAPTVGAAALTDHLAFPLVPSASQKTSTTNGLAQEEIHLPVHFPWGTAILGAFVVVAGVVAGGFVVEHRLSPTVSSASPASVVEAPPAVTEPPPMAPEPSAVPESSAPPESPAAASAPLPEPPTANVSGATSAPPESTQRPETTQHPETAPSSPGPEAAQSAERPETPHPSAKPRWVAEPGPPRRVTPAASQFVPPMPQCNPNFVVDAEGNKIFKPECFPAAPPL